MLKILRKIISINKIQAIGIHNNGNETIFYFIKTSRKANEITIKESNIYKNVEDLIINLDNKIPIILNFDGKGVLNKKIDFENEQDANWFLNLDLNLLSYFKVNFENTSFISFTKKEEIAQWIEYFNEKKFSVIDFYIGSFISILLQSINTKQTIKTAELELQLEKNKLVNFTKLKDDLVESYSVDNYQLSSKYISSFSSILNFYINDSSFEKSYSTNLNYDNYIFERGFLKLGKFTLIFYFSFLLFSYIGINYLSKTNSKLNYQNYFMLNTLNKYDNLEKIKNNKLKISNEIGAYSSKYYSYYISEIINTTNSNINFKNLEINKIENEFKPNKKIIFTSNEIYIQGISVDEQNFYFWIERLKKINFINKIEIGKINLNKEGKFEFEIKIKLSYV